METQWRCAAGSAGLVFTGLDYSAMSVVLEELNDLPYRLPLSKLMPQLRTLEFSARTELNAA